MSDLFVMCQWWGYNPKTKKTKKCIYTAEPEYGHGMFNNMCYDKFITALNKEDKPRESLLKQFFDAVHERFDSYTAMNTVWGQPGGAPRYTFTMRADKNNFIFIVESAGVTVLDMSFPCATVTSQRLQELVAQVAQLRGQRHPDPVRPDENRLAYRVPSVPADRLGVHQPPANPQEVEEMQQELVRLRVAVAGGAQARGPMRDVTPPHINIVSTPPPPYQLRSMSAASKATSPISFRGAGGDLPGLSRAAVLAAKPLPASESSNMIARLRQERAMKKKDEHRENFLRVKDLVDKLLAVQLSVALLLTRKDSMEYHELVLRVKEEADGWLMRLGQARDLEELRGYEGQIIEATREMMDTQRILEGEEEQENEGWESDDDGKKVVEQELE